MIPKSPKTELILAIIDNVPKNAKSTHTRIQKTVYLVGNKLREKYGKDSGYKFDSFSSLEGPYDINLTRDIDLWGLCGLFENRNPRSGPNYFLYYDADLRPGRLARPFIQETGREELARFLGNKKDVEWLRKLASEYGQKTEAALIEEAVNHYSENHPEKVVEIKESFPFVVKV